MSTLHHARLMRLARTALAALGVLAATAQAQTVTTGAAEVRAFHHRSGTNVYAAAYGGGLYLSTNTGTSFARVALPGNVRYLTALTGSASVMIVGADEGLLRTTDFTTFTPLLHEPVSALAMGGTTVLAGIKGVGIVRSTDSGANWAVANNTGFDSTDITAIAFHPGNANLVFATATPDGTGARGGVFKSSDGGATWSNFTGNLPNRFATSVALDSSGTVFVGLMNPADNQGDVYSSSSAPAAGAWSASGDVFGGVVSVHRDLNAGTTMWVGGRSFGLFTGSGTAFNYAWPQNGQPNIFFTGVNAVTTIAGNTAVVLKAIRGAGVWRSAAVASPRTWTRVNFPGADRVLSATGVAGGGTNTMFVGLYAGGAGRSTNAGASFAAPTVTGAQADFSLGAAAAQQQPFASVWDLSASPSNPNLVYAATGGVGMFYTNDTPGMFRWNGTVWEGVGTNPAPAPYNIVNDGFFLPSFQLFGATVNRGNDQIVYASMLTGHQLFRRTGPGSWTQVAIPGVPGTRAVVPSAVNGNKAIALPYDDKPAISMDAGASFTQVGVSHFGFERIRFFSASESANGTVWVGGTNKGVFRSADGGFNWSRVAMGGVFQSLAITATGFRPGSNSNVLAADAYGNRYCSTNAGASWASAGSQLPAGVRAIRAIGSNLYYLTDGAGLILETGC